jgi:hypothetical protein
MSLLGFSGISSSFMYSQHSESVLDDASEILPQLEILLCFVKRTAVGDGEKSIKDYISQWMKLSSLCEHTGFSRMLKIDLRLKHLVALYEFVEEQVANLKIRYIHDKYKASISVDMETEILQSVDFEQQTTTKELIPAEAFALALKRFMLRFLTLENQKEIDPLWVYLRDSSLNFWPSTVPEDRIEELFPESLLVANTYDAYEFTMKKIEQTMRKQQASAARNQAINPAINNPIINSRTLSSRSPLRKSKKDRSRFDAM